jgi:hypothetical protein
MTKRTSRTRRIDDIRRPPEYRRIKANEELMQGMRWLYESDAEFERAKKKMAAELSREELKKQLTRKARIKKVQNAAARLRGMLKKAPVTASKIIRIAFSPQHRRKTLVSVSSVAAVVVLGYAISQTSNSNPHVLGDDLPSEPTYNVLVPGDEIANTTSGRIAYDRQKQLTSYTDNIGNAQATISQQPLPEKVPERQHDVQGDGGIEEGVHACSFALRLISSRS